MRTRPSLLFLWLLALPRMAAADDKVACVRAGEAAQELRSNGKLVEARDMLLTCMRDSCPALVRKDCTQWLGEIDASTPTIVVRARDGSGRDLRDVRVSVDGKVVAPQLDGRPIAVNPGEHAVKYDRAGKSLDDRVILATGEKNRLLTVQFADPIAPPPKVIVTPPKEKEAPPPEPVKAGPPAGAWIFAGVSALALGTFAVFGTVGKSDIDDLRGRCAGHCSESEVDRAWNKLIVADAALGVSVVAAGIAAWLFLSPRATIAPSPHGATVHFTARF